MEIDESTLTQACAEVIRREKDALTTGFMNNALGSHVERYIETLGHAPLRTVLALTVEADTKCPQYDRNVKGWAKEVCRGIPPDCDNGNLVLRTIHPAIINQLASRLIKREADLKSSPPRGRSVIV